MFNEISADAPSLLPRKNLLDSGDHDRGLGPQIIERLLVLCNRAFGHDVGNAIRERKECHECVYNPTHFFVNANLNLSHYSTTAMSDTSLSGLSLNRNDLTIGSIQNFTVKPTMWCRFSVVYRGDLIISGTPCKVNMFEIL